MVDVILSYAITLLDAVLLTQQAADILMCMFIISIMAASFSFSMIAIGTECIVGTATTWTRTKISQLVT